MNEIGNLQAILNSTQGSSKFANLLVQTIYTDTIYKQIKFEYTYCD